MPVPSDWADNLKSYVGGWWAASETRNLGDEYLGDAPFPHFVLTEQAKTWKAFLAWVAELDGMWCFRGQRDARWTLNTSLDRAVKKEHSSPTSQGYWHLDREPEIRELLFRFQQQAHQYAPSLPPDDDLASWFAIMQHYGVPTRFLDWTKSAYVGVYFALEEELQKQGAALWAIDMEWLEDKARKLLPPTDTGWGDLHQRAEYVNGLLTSEMRNAVIVPVNPSRIDARMVAQQGFFLCKLYHQVPFSQVLMTMMMHPKTDTGPDLPDRPVIRKLIVKPGLRIEFLKKLRAMNIHRASLFPGLDGFGQSLKLDLEIKVKS